jgi:transmembrane sensor
MKNEFEHIDDLVAKVLAGEASEKEKAYLEQWSLASDENRSYVEEARKLFGHVASVKEDKAVDVNTAWKKVDNRIEGKGTRIVTLPKRKRNIRIAAAIALIICMSISLKLLINNTKEESVVYAAITDVVERKLPDGSKIAMNKHTKLSYAVKNNVREVKLEGEAYFEVVHKAEQPFVINVNGIMIRDIGTAFNVKALAGGDEVEVKVNEGEVQFYDENGEGLKLVKGEKAVYKRSSKQFTRVTSTIFDNTASYHSKVLNFKGSKLQDALDQLNELAGTKIRLANPKLGECPINVSFDLNKQTIPDILGVIAEIMEMKVQKTKEGYLLSDGLCPII